MYKNTNGDRSKRRRIIPPQPVPEPEEGPENNDGHGIFEGFRIYIHQDINTTRTRCLRNLIRKNGGTNVLEADGDVTHILVDESLSGSKLCRSLRWDAVPENVNVLAVGWVSASLQANHIANYASYSVACPRIPIAVDSPDTPNSENVERSDASGEDNFEIRTRKFAKSTAPRSAYETVILEERKFWSPVDEGSSFDDYRYNQETSCEDEWLLINPPTPPFFIVSSNTEEELEGGEEVEEEEEYDEEEDYDEGEEYDDDDEEEDEDFNEDGMRVEEDDETEQSNYDDDINMPGPSTSYDYSKPSTSSKRSTSHAKKKPMVPIDERPNTTAGRLSCLRLKVINGKDGGDRNWVVVNLKKGAKKNGAEEPSTSEAVPSTSKEQESNKGDSGKACSMTAEENDASEVTPGTSGSVSPNSFPCEFPSSSSKKVSHRKHGKTGKKNEEMPSTSYEVQNDFTNHKEKVISESWNPNIPSSSTENIPQRKHKKKRKRSSVPSSPDVQDEAINRELRAIPEEVTNNIPTSSTEKSSFRKHKKNKHGKSCLSPNMQGDTSNLEGLSVAEDMPHSISSSTGERHPDRKKGKKKRKSRSTPSSPNIHNELNYKDLVAPENALIGIASTSTANILDEIDKNNRKGKFGKKGKNYSAPATPNSHHIAFANFSGHIDMTQSNLENSKFSSNIQDKSSDDNNCFLSEDILHGIPNSATDIPLGQKENKQEEISLPTNISTPDFHNESCKQEEFVPESTSPNGLTSSTAISRTIEDDLINYSSGTLSHAGGSRKRKRSIDDELKLDENSEQNYSYSTSNIASSVHLNANVTNSDILEVSHVVCRQHTTVNSSNAVEPVFPFNSPTLEANPLFNSSLLTTVAPDNEETSAAAEKSLPSPKSTQINSSETDPCTVKFSASSEIIRELPQSSKLSVAILTSPKDSITEHSVDKTSVPDNAEQGYFLPDKPESNYSASKSLKIASFDSSGTLPVSAESQIDDLPNLPELNTSVAVAPHTASPNLSELDTSVAVAPCIASHNLLELATSVAVAPHTVSPNLPESDTSVAFAPHTASPHLPELDISVAVAPHTASPNLLESDTSVAVAPHTASPNLPESGTSVADAPHTASPHLPELNTSVAVAPHTPSPNSNRFSVQDNLPQVTLPISSVTVSQNAINVGGLETALALDQLHILLPSSPEDPSKTKFLLPISNLRIDQQSQDAIIEKLVMKNVLHRNIHGVDKNFQAEPEIEYILPDIPVMDLCTPTDSSTTSLKKSKNENKTSTVESSLGTRSVIQYAKSTLQGNQSTSSDLHENKLKTDLKNEISVNMDEGVKGTENAEDSPSEKEVSLIKNENLASTSTNSSDENVAIIVEDILDKLEPKPTGYQASPTGNVSTGRMDSEMDFQRIEQMDVDSASDTSSDSSENEEMEISDREFFGEPTIEQSLEMGKSFMKPVVIQSELSKCEKSSVLSEPSVSDEIRPYPVKLFCSNHFDTVSRINELSNSPETDSVLFEIDFLLAQLELSRGVDASCETEESIFDFLAKLAKNPNYFVEEAERLRKIRWGYWMFPKSSVVKGSDKLSLPQQDVITNNSEGTEPSSVPPVNTNLNMTNSISIPSTDIEMNNPEPTPSTSFASSNVEEDTEPNNGTIRLEVTQSAPAANVSSLFSRPDVTGRNLFFPLPSERPSTSTAENAPAQVPDVENQTTMCYLSPECPNYKIIAKLQELYDFFKMSRDVYRIHAYEKAIFGLGKHPKLIESVQEAQTISGVGRKMSFKVWEIARTGELNEIKNYCHRRWIEAKKLFTKGWGITTVTARELYLKFANEHDTSDSRVARAMIKEFCSVAEAWSEAHFLNRSQRLALQYYDDLSKTMTRDEAETIVTIVTGFFKEHNKKLTIEACSTLRRNKKVCSYVSVLVILEKGVVNDRPVLDDVVAAMHKKGYIVDDLIRHEYNGNQSKYSGLFRVNKMARYRRLDICVSPYMERVCAKFFLTGPSYFLRAMVRCADKKLMVLDEHCIRFRILNMYGGTDYVTELNARDERSIFKMVGVPYRSPEERDFIPLCTYLND